MALVSSRRLCYPISACSYSLSQTLNSRPVTAGYLPLAPYTDEDTTFANHVLCPRYAENDPTSAPPSPASLESFDILDSIPWRRSYISLDTPAGESSTFRHALANRWRKHRARVIAITLLLALLLTGCTLAAYITSQTHLTTQCLARNGGEKCKQAQWAKCIAHNGLG